jgi:DNA-binding response OmpR family regulator
MKRILIVDDSLTVRADLMEAFGARQMDTLPCATLAEARAALASEDIGLLVLDVLLPDGDGIDLLRELRATPQGAAMPVLMLSSEAQVSDRIRGLATGSSDYVGKPYDRDYVVARAARLLGRDGDDAPVLLIDDSITFREQLASMLRDAGYRVAQAASGAEGLRSMALQRPAAVVIDGVLPDTSGAEVVRALRLDAALRHLPCVLLTGSSGLDNELRALDSGADAFVRKDEDLDLILARVTAVLRKSGAPAGAGPASLRGGHRILAVDDSPTFLHRLADTLAGEGYDVILAQSGEEALTMMRAQAVDCILLDRLMPGLSGTETCARLKTDPATRDIPLIMLTATEDREAMIEGLSTGADDYVLKSSEFDVLKARVRAQLRRKQFEDESRRIRAELSRQELEAVEMRAARALFESRAELLEQLERKNRDLEAMVEQLRARQCEIDEKNRQLEQADRLKSEFLSTMSHELRTPLNAIIGFSDLLAGGVVGPLSPRQQTCVGHVNTSGKHLLALINDILDLSKVEAGRMELQLEPVMLNEQLTGCLDIVRDAATRRGVTLECAPCAGLERMVLDLRKFKQMAYNLLSNAVKFTTSGSCVRLAARIVDNSALQAGPRPGWPARVLPPPPGPFRRWLEVSVSDQGAGIAQADLGKLFEAFRQLDAGIARQHEGTGLGLSLVARIAQLHGGTVGVASQAGQGACFAFWLPLRTCEPEAAAVPLTRYALVIEDDPAAIDLLRLHLESLGFEVGHAVTAEQALRQARARQPDLITLDLLLPDASGWHVLEHLRAEAALAAVPVLIVSIVADEMKAFMLGAAHVLQKPLQRDALRQALDALGMGVDGGQAPSVMIVDREDSCAALSAGLSGLNYRITCHHTAADAVAAARRSQVDLLVLGMEVPDASAFDLIDAVRSASPVPVMVLADEHHGDGDLAHLRELVLRKGSFDSQQFAFEVGRALCAGHAEHGGAAWRVS